MKDLSVEQKHCLEMARLIREGLPGVKFDMADYRNHCGTAGCIAGLTIAYYRPRLWEKEDWEASDYFNAASSILGLGKQAYKLFIPWYWGGPRLHDITPEMASATLERFALTGKVKWIV